MKSSPFNHRPDPELGDLLREALGPCQDEAFVNRVMAGFDEAQRKGLPFVDILADWSRVGVAAAVVMAAIGAFMLRPTAPTETASSIDDILAEEPIPAALVAAPVPDPNAVLAVAIDR